MYFYFYIFYLPDWLPNLSNSRENYSRSGCRKTNGLISRVAHLHAWEWHFDLLFVVFLSSVSFFCLALTRYITTGTVLFSYLFLSISPKSKPKKESLWSITIKCQLIERVKETLKSKKEKPTRILPWDISGWLVDPVTINKGNILSWMSCPS